MGEGLLPVIKLKALNRFLPKEKFRMEGLDTARSRYVKAIILRNPSSVMPTMQSQVTGSRGNIFFSSSREQFTSSVAAHRPVPGSLRLHHNPPSVLAKLCSEGIQTVVYLDHLLQIHHQKDKFSDIFLYVRRPLSSLGSRNALRNQLFV